MKRTETLKRIISGLPDTPGVYQFFNDQEQLIYVGKAKSLKKRVSSYFTRGKYDNAKTAILVRHIQDIKYILVETELDALLLENNLIKKHQPRYNVLLKDDKTYPWICIKNENFPRVFSTRKFIRDGSQYFGPFASAKMVNTLLELIHKIFKIRTCHLALTPENIAKGKFKVCLEYQIGNCLGPCEGLQTQDDYDQSVQQVKEILKGNIHTVISYLNGLMKKSADAFRYEEAQVLKDKIEILDNYRSKSVVVNSSIHNIDVFCIIDRGKIAYVNFLKVMNGAIIQSHTIELKKKLDESIPELLSLAIAELRNRYNSESNEIIVNELPDMELPGVTFTIPKIGDKKHLLGLSIKNLTYYIREQELKQEKLDPEVKIDRIMEQMKNDLRMRVQPRYIECFDNSNLQGTDPVAAVAVFRNGRASKKEYRHFNIKTVEGPDDFASMEEVIFRRYKRLIDENAELPQLIVIDGGKGQLSSAVGSLRKLGVYGKVTIIGIAKRLEEIYFPGDPVPLYLDKKGESLRIIQQIRDEVHRFGIAHHRKLREKKMKNTSLSEINGIGNTTAELLLSHFKSVKKISESSFDELSGLIGQAKAKMVFDHFNRLK